MSVNNLFSAFSFISFVLVTIPFAWHLKTSNTATCLYMFWVSLSSLVLFINSVIWDGNVINRAPVWCDISSHIILATGFALPATCLCIQRLLYRIISNPSVDISLQERRRIIIIDMMLCLGMPILNITLAYFSQPQRYFIFEDVGCYIMVVTTPFSCQPNGLNIYHLSVKRRIIRSLLGSSTGNLHFSRYLRLFLLSGIDLVLTIPFNVWYFCQWFPLSQGMSWASIHANFSRIDKIPASSWRAHPHDLITIEWTRWNSVIYAFTFVLLFGMTDQARRHYKLALQFVGKKAGYHTGPSVSSERLLSKNANVGPGSMMYSHDAGFESQCYTLDKSNAPGYPGGESRSTTLPLTRFDYSDTKHGFPSESQFAPWLTPTHSLSSTPQFRIPRIKPPPMTLDLESTRGRLQPLVFKTSPTGSR